MKRIYLIFSLIASAAGFLSLGSCEKNDLRLTNDVVVEDKAYLKVGYFTAWARNPGVQVKMNNQRVSNNLTYAISFPGGGLNMLGSLNNDYLALPPGSNSIQLSIPKAGSNTDSLELYKGTINLALDKKQTVFLTDTVPNIQATVVADPIIDDVLFGFARMKFFNGIPNWPSIDLYVVTASAGTIVIRDIGYKGVSAAFDVPIGSTTFQIVRAGQPNITANQLATYTTTPTSQRIYTVLTRGYVGLVSPDIRRPFISLIVNR